jgi:hypothetical protein
MRAGSVFAVAVAFSLLAVPGCIDDADPGGDASDDDARTYEDCDTLTVPFEANETSWEAARIECDANTTGTDTQRLSCPSPDEAQLAVSTNLTAGQVAVTVLDADEATVAEHELGDTEGEARELDVDAGAAGEWTLEGERLEGFEGTYQAELACPQG